MSDKEVLANLSTVLDEEHAAAIVAHRRHTIKKPLTAYAAKLLAKRLAEYGDANAAADIMIERTWQGFSCEWLKGRGLATHTNPAPYRGTMSDLGDLFTGADHERIIN